MRRFKRDWNRGRMEGRMVGWDGKEGNGMGMR